MYIAHMFPHVLHIFMHSFILHITKSVGFYLFYFIYMLIFVLETNSIGIIYLEG
jgi:hypothetical protein